MALQVGSLVLREGAFGAEPGEITDRVGEEDCWYVTVGPGQTYICEGSDLTPVVADIGSRLGVAPGVSDERADGRSGDPLN
jgi:hypothetical protein